MQNKIVEEYKELLPLHGEVPGELIHSLGEVGTIDYAFNKYYSGQILHYKPIDNLYFSYEPDMKLIQEKEDGPYLTEGTFTLYVPESGEDFVYGRGLGTAFRRLIAILLGVVNFKETNYTKCKIKDIDYSKIETTYPDGKVETVDTVNILDKKYKFLKFRMQMTYDDYVSFMLEKDGKDLEIINDDSIKK